MLNEKQNSIFIGSMLGDGCIWTDFNGQYKLQVIQSKEDNNHIDKYSYLYWYTKEFYTFGCSIKPRTTIASGLLKEVGTKELYNSYVFYTKCGHVWSTLEKLWYKEIEHAWYKRKKIIPNSIHITPLSLAVWHMDDGYNNQKDGNIELNTQGFSLDEVNFLIERLKTDLGIYAKPKNAKRKSMKKQEQYKIYVGHKSYFDFIELIKPLVEWDCFQYKLDTSGYTKKPNRGETSPVSILTEDKIKQIFQLRNDGLLHKEIAEIVGVSKTSISLILSGKRWKHLGMSRYIKNKPRIKKDNNILFSDV